MPSMSVATVPTPSSKESASQPSSSQLSSRSWMPTGWRVSHRPTALV
ncbi:hypothetical protein ABT282_35295 [Streptomyces sp. NPDC000927]